MADSKKVPAPKHRKAKSSSAEAFRKFLNKRVDIIEEDDSEGEVVAPVVVKKDKKTREETRETRCVARPIRRPGAATGGCPAEPRNALPEANQIKETRQGQADERHTATISGIFTRHPNCAPPSTSPLLGL